MTSSCSPASVARDTGAAHTAARSPRSPTVPRQRVIAAAAHRTCDSTFEITTTLLSCAVSIMR
jgi:hypothetical protein